MGTEGARYPFWSPDGRDVAFFADARLKRVPIAGGPAQTIADAPGPWPHGSWGPGGILFSLSTTRNAGIQLVGTTGGAPSKLPIDGAVFDPQWLPDGRHFLYINGDRDPARIFAASIDGRQAPVAVQELDQAVTASGGDPGFRYSDAGYLLFNNAGVLSLRSFDAATLKVGGPLKAIGDKVGTPRGWFAVSVGLNGRGAQPIGRGDRWHARRSDLSASMGRSIGTHRRPVGRARPLLDDAAVALWAACGCEP